MTKLCIITHSYPRFAGDWRSNFIESLACAYARQGVDVTVFVPYTPLFNRNLINSEGVKIVCYRYLPFDSLHTIGYGHSMKADLKITLLDMFLMPFMLLIAIIKFAFLLKREKFDVIHAHWGVPNGLIAVLGKLFCLSSAKIITSFPGSDVTVISKFGWIGRIFAKIIAKSDLLTCNSSDLRDDLVKAGFHKDRIEFVIYGVDDKKISFSDEERVSQRYALEVSEDELVLLIVGRFVPKKGFSAAFKALKYITEISKKVVLVVVGDGPMKEEYHDILKRDQTEQYVKFAGEILPQELSKYYSACDIFLMPSMRLPADGLNVVVPEAMACGRPIVASRVGGNDLVVFDDVNGYLHDENDPRQLADLVIKLSQDLATMISMGQKSIDLVQERFNWDVIAQSYLHMISI